MQAELRHDHHFTRSLISIAANKCRLFLAAKMIPDMAAATWGVRIMPSTSEILEVPSPFYLAFKKKDAMYLLSWQVVRVRIWHVRGRRP